MEDAVEGAGEGAGGEFFGFFLEADFLPVDEFGAFGEEFERAFAAAGIVGAEGWGCELVTLWDVDDFLALAALEYTLNKKWLNIANPRHQSIDHNELPDMF